jgi:hypothetical protein
MISGPRRGVTRSYVGGLMSAALVAALAGLVASWGLLTWGMGRDPLVSADAPFWVAPLIIFVALTLLAAALWQQALILLRGKSGPAWEWMVTVALGAYLLWCLACWGFGFSVEDTWLSPFAALLAAVWGLSSLAFWVVLVRRVYTDRPTPRWPWEGEGDAGSGL